MDLLKKASWFTKYRRLRKKYKRLLLENKRLRIANGRRILKWDADNEERKLNRDCIKEYRALRDKEEEDGYCKRL